MWVIVPVGLAMAAALLYYLNRIDEEIRSQVQQRFAAHYSHLMVSVHSAQRIEGQGIYIRGLSIKDPSIEGSFAELVYVDEVFLKCQPSLEELLRGDVQVRHVALRNMTIRTVKQPDGNWTVARLVPLPSFGGEFPTASIENATLEVRDATADPAASMTLRDIHLAVKPQAASPSNSHRSPHAGREEFHHAQRDAYGTEPGQQLLAVEGTLSSAHFDQLKLAGVLNPGLGQWRVRGSVANLNVSPELRQSLPKTLAGPLTPLGNLRAKANLNFDVQTQTGQPIPYGFRISGRLAQGTLKDARLPQPLTEIAASVVLNNSGLTITDLKAQGGSTSLELSLRRSGWQTDSPLWLSARARRLNLDSSLARLLPEAMQPYWQAYSPSGTCDVDLKLMFDGRRWQPDLLLRCLDVSFLYERFPYPLTGTKGILHYQEDTARFQLQAMADGQPVRIEGNVQNPGDDFVGWIEAETEGPIALDAKLLAALDTDEFRSTKEIAESFKPRGTLTCRARFSRQSPEQKEIEEHILVRLLGCSIEYENFAYPLQRVSGVIEVNPQQVQFREFSGRNDSGFVTCKGVYRTSDPDPVLSLEFAASDVPLEDELRDALTWGARKVWKDLRPRGTLDHLGIQLHYWPERDQLSLDIAAQKWPAKQNVDGREVSLHPGAFPYRLSHVTGAARWKDGNFQFDGVRARHGKVEASASGYCTVADDGHWKLKLTRLTADHLRADQELIAALPKQIAAAVDQLKISGPVDVSGTMTFQSSGARQEDVSSDWDLSFDLENGGLSCGVTLENIHGGVRLRGSSTSEKFFNRGELAIDSLMFKGFQFTQITGPLWIDTERILLGQWSQSQQDRERGQPRPLTARAFDGTIELNLQSLLAGQRKFNLQAELEGADLNRFSREMLPPARQISGRASGNIRLQGNAEGTHTLRGQGNVWLREAYVYQLPVMVALLKILSIKPPERNAFTTGDINFRVAGEHIYLDRIDLDGDAISLKGNGEVNLQREIHMRFYTLVGRDHLPLIWPVLADASRRILMIEVTGTLDQPITSRKVLPGLNDTLHQLFPEELGTRPAQSAGRAPTRPRLLR